LTERVRQVFTLAQKVLLATFQTEHLLLGLRREVKSQGIDVSWPR
jgi:hypothetical protein